MVKKVHTLKSAADELGMAIVNVPRHLRDSTWTFIARNLERLRPIGFDGHQVICNREDVERVTQVLIR